MLLRVGIDKGTDGALGPIFPDGSFEYIPIGESCPSAETRTFANTAGRAGHRLSTYLPPRVASRTLHYDPEFDTYTYGDPTRKRASLKRLLPDDLLIFYAGLAPFRHDRQATALYVIGYFTVEHVVDYAQPLSPAQLAEADRRCAMNAHAKRGERDALIVTGRPEGSKLLDEAVRISETALDRRGRPYQVVSASMEGLLGIRGSIQRAVPRWVREEPYLTNLKRLLRL